MIVRDIMIRDIASIDAEESVYNACKIFRDRKVGSVFIKNNNGLVGIVTERDLIERAMLELMDIKETRIKEIMTTDLKSVDPLDKVEKALELMKANKIKKLAVIQGSELVGVITLSDIAHSRPSVKNFLKSNEITIS